MTQREKDLKLASLKTQIEMLEDEKRALAATPVTVHKVWEPNNGDQYIYTIGLGEFSNRLDEGDRTVLPLGLAHPTKEAAERHHSFLVMLHDLHKFAAEENEGWKPDFNDSGNKYSIGIEFGGWTVTSWNNYRYNILPYFKSHESAQKAIDTFGDRLKILFEYYNS